MTPVPGAPPSIYLTFDDGPNADWTPPLLDALRETGARATFFLIDAQIDAATAAIVKRIADEGHAICGSPARGRYGQAARPEVASAGLYVRATVRRQGAGLEVEAT